jgi:hypothetical protein
VLHKPQPTTGEKATLRAALHKLNLYQADLAEMNQTSMRYGFGRLDAVGHIPQQGRLCRHRR